MNLNNKWRHTKNKSVIEQKIDLRIIRLTSFLQWIIRREREMRSYYALLWMNNFSSPFIYSSINIKYLSIIRSQTKQNKSSLWGKLLLFLLFWLIEIAVVFSRQDHPFYDKHDELLKAIWSLDRSASGEAKLAKVKAAVAASSPAKLVDIFDDKTGESKAKVPPLIIACFEGDYDLIKFLIEVISKTITERERERETKTWFERFRMVPIPIKLKVNMN